LRNLTAFKGIIACPACRVSLGEERGTPRCASCGISYPVENGSPVLLTPRGRVEATEMLERPGGRRMRTAYGGEDPFLRTVKLAARLISSEFAPLRKRFRRPIMDLLESGGKVLEVGSGARRIFPGVLNLDIAPFPGVDIVGMADELPVADDTLDGVILEVTLEHVRNLPKAAAEAVRVLRPGGRVFAVLPFVFPFHGHPDDFWRATMPGLRELFKPLSVEDSGVYHGPASMLINVLSDVPAGIVFPGHGRGYMVLKGLCLIPIFWLKYADFLLVRLPGSLHYASTLFLVGRKK